MADRRSEAGPSGGDFSVGSVYPAEGHVPAGKAGIYTVLYVFRVEECGLGDHTVLYGARGRRGAGIFSTEFVAEYPGHFERLLAEERAAWICDPADSGGDTGCELRNLRAGVRTVRRPGSARGKRGVS